ncbi:hypothetical protein ACWGIV_26420 [Streptomyces sp. NPDC054844]
MKDLPLSTQVLIWTFGFKLMLFVGCTFFALLVGTLVTWLSHKPGERKRDAVKVGLYAFGGTVVGCATVLMLFGVL